MAREHRATLADQTMEIVAAIYNVFSTRGSDPVNAIEINPYRQPRAEEVKPPVKFPVSILKDVFCKGPTR